MLALVDTYVLLVRLHKVCLFQKKRVFVVEANMLLH